VRSQQYHHISYVPAQGLDCYQMRADNWHLLCIIAFALWLALEQRLAASKDNARCSD
jgi:hypothetical protein